jgi:hypothetical protein
MRNNCILLTIKKEFRILYTDMVRTASIVISSLWIVCGGARAIAAPSTPWTVIAWNDLGMHCMDADYSVFAILPPFNNIHAQVIDSSGKLVRTAAGMTVTYEAVADSNGSINTTSAGKNNFWDYVKSLFGAVLDMDTGLTGARMPGPANTPQPLAFDPAKNGFIASGIPMTPTDDSGQKNYYPMLRVVVRDASGGLLADTRIVTPVSDEMSCRACHSSGSPTPAQPPDGWVNDPNPDRDYKLNILLMHDYLQSESEPYANALVTAGYNTGGLYATVTADSTPVLCARCHASNALGTQGVSGVPPLTTSMHGFHARQRDPETALTLDNQSNRDACYRCHPGSTTRCLRGAMGNAVNPDGSMQMQCQSCHGSMSDVGAPERQGWLDEPNCQACHTGTAAQNSGQIRFTSVFDGAGQMRQPGNRVFATTLDMPAPGISLYRFSSGHSGMQCEACHGSTHAEFTSSEGNDNAQSIALQGYAGVLTDCGICHRTAPSDSIGGPHGMHVVGQQWVAAHQRMVRSVGLPACQACHGMDYRGTILSAARAARTLSIENGARTFAAGTQIGCYSCHNGPNGG